MTMCSWKPEVYNDLEMGSTITVSLNKLLLALKSKHIHLFPQIASSVHWMKQQHLINCILETGGGGGGGGGG